MTKKAKTVRMRITREGEDLWLWNIWLGEVWIGPNNLRSLSSLACKRSANAWAKRMGLTPEWE